MKLRYYLLALFLGLTVAACGGISRVQPGYIGSCRDKVATSCQPYTTGCTFRFDPTNGQPTPETKLCVGPAILSCAASRGCTEADAKNVWPQWF